MIRNQWYFFRRYKNIEEEFLEITDFIELNKDFDNCCYKVGSSKLMDFCLKVGSEIETLFKILLFSEKFDEIRKNGDDKSIDKYRPILEKKYYFSEYSLMVIPIQKIIKPFESFDKKRPEWFGIYSKSKHNKIDLIEKWNLKHSLYALSCLFLLVINHPDVNGEIFFLKNCRSKVFDYHGSRPRFAKYIIREQGDVPAIGEEVEVVTEQEFIRRHLPKFIID